MKLFLKATLQLVVFFIMSKTYGQSEFVVNSDVFGRRVFIENNGQFDTNVPKLPKIDYAYINGEEQVYFNKSGLTYLLQKQLPLTESQREAKEHGDKKNYKPLEKLAVTVTWENANPNVELVASDKQSNFQSFGDEKYKSNCYKKITYKNIYNHIDIEYLFTNTRKDGIKYNIILHPGANLADIKIKYGGAIKRLKLKDGDIIIKTAAINIVELAPKSYQNGNLIVSKFRLNGKTISFILPNGYDTNTTLTIDPWITNLALATNNYGYDVDYDYAGNYYVYGGNGPYLISKYSSSGILLWTFSGIISSINWNSNPLDKNAGNFIVDKVTGKVYTGQGINLSGTRIVRLTTNGVYDNFMNNAVSSLTEIWDMGYRCSDGAIFGFGGSNQSNSSAGILNTTTATIAPQNFSALPTTDQDVISHTIDQNGNVFLIFASSATPSLNNSIMRVNASFNGSNWIRPSNYNSFNEGFNKNAYTNMQGYSNGYNALASNKDFLYYYDGFNLAAYNKLTGNRIAFTTIPGQTLLKQGGIAVDACNNLYLGGDGFINCYNFNGVTFTANGLIPIATTAPLKFVFDVKLKPDTNELYVSGSGFGGVYVAINSNACVNTATVSVAQTFVSPNNTTAIATVVTAVASPTINYTWFNSSNAIVSQTNNSLLLTNTVTNLTNGTYTVLIQIGSTCGFYSSQSFVINNVVAIRPTFNQVPAICEGTTLANLPTTSTNGITGTWMPALNNLATTIYTFIPNIGQNATAVTMTITVIPKITPTFTAVPAICEGTTLANLPTTSTNGITGAWLPAINNMATTNYIFTPTTGLCTNTAQLTITVIPKITPTFTAVPDICEGTTLANLPTTSTNGITGSWSPALNNMATTNYIFTPTTGLCANTAQLTITVIPKITPTFTAVPDICEGTTLANLPTTSTNGITGSWSPAINNMATTNYIFTPTTGLCANTAQLTITVIPKSTPTFNPISSICYGSVAHILPNISANGYTGNWYPSVINNTQSSSYQFTPSPNQCAGLPLPVAITVYNDFNFDIIHKCIGNNYTLQIVPTANSFDMNIANFLWTNSTNITVGNNNSIFDVTNHLITNNITPQFPLIYNATVTLPNGCLKKITTNLLSSYCEIQKGISPNNDGNNDFFDLRLLNVRQLKIFNRYGLNVYTLDNYFNQWIGQNDSGQELPDGTYYYSIEFNTAKPAIVGWIYINRENK